MNYKKKITDFSVHAGIHSERNGMPFSCHLLVLRHKEFKDQGFPVLTIIHYPAAGPVPGKNLEPNSHLYPDELDV